MFNFLPAAGYRHGDFLGLVGSYGRYLSSSLYTDTTNFAYSLYFTSDNVSAYRSDYRCLGHSVRPVSE